MKHTMSVTGRTLATIALTGTLAGTLGLAIPAAAHASGGGDGRVTASGTCDGPARWKIKAKPDDGRIEVESEIDSNQSGQQWHWVLKHNGSRSAAGSSRTTGRSGSFEVERRTVDASGSDTFVFTATKGGSTCTARVRL